MSQNDYTPEQALTLLIDKLTQADTELARQVREAVNTGRDIQETEQSDRRRRKKVRSYRRTVPYAPEQALQIAINVLKAHFVEQPLFINSCNDNMAQAAIGVVTPKSPLWT